MDKYYDYMQEKYVEGDPSVNLVTQMLGINMMMSNLHRMAEEGKRKRAEKAKADKSPFYKMYEFGELIYVKKFLRDSYKQCETWAERLRNYNDTLVDYLTRKDYLLKAWQKPEYYTLNLKDYKSICKQVLKVL